MSALDGNLAPGKTLETATRTALAEEETLSHNLNNQRLARQRELNDTRSSIDWLNSALGVTRVVLNSSADVACVHRSVEQQSQISLHGLTERINELTHSMNPICRMPAEILEQIFELATLDERSILQGNFISRQAFHASRGALYCTVPRIPTILASTCRHWRTITLNMALLWSFLRVPTLETYQCAAVSRACIVGLSTFQQAKMCIRTAKCEVVVGPTYDWTMTHRHLCSVPPSQISTINIVSPLSRQHASQIPTASVLRIISRSGSRVSRSSVLLPSYSLPTSVLANTRELDFHDALPAVNTPVLSVTRFSLSLNRRACFPDLGHSLANFPNLTALVLSTNIDNIFRQHTTTPLHHARIRALSITDTIIPHLRLLLEQGALSLPSLTHFILLDIFPSSHRTRWWNRLQSLVVNVTYFEIRAATQQGSGSNIRRLLNVMPLLQQVTLFDTAVDDGLEALLVAPIKRIGQLIVSDSKTDGLNVKLYYDTLKSESVDRLDDELDMSIQFMNCPYILPQIREQLLS